MVTVRALLVSGLAGILFATAWWVLVDAIQINALEPPKHQPPFLWYYYMPPIWISVFAILLNTLDPKSMRQSSFSFGDDDEGACCGSGLVCKRFWVFAMLAGAFTCLGGAIWIAVGVYDANVVSNPYPGFALIVQAALVILSGLLFWLARSL